MSRKNESNLIELTAMELDMILYTKFSIKVEPSSFSKGGEDHKIEFWSTTLSLPLPFEIKI